MRRNGATAPFPTQLSASPASTIQTGRGRSGVARRSAANAGPTAYPFTPLVTIPWTMYRWTKKKTTISGSA
jgi:hypothetical protein